MKKIKWGNPTCCDCGNWGQLCTEVSVEHYVDAENCGDFLDIRDYDTEVYKK